MPPARRRPCSRPKKPPATTACRPPPSSSIITARGAKPPWPPLSSKAAAGPKPFPPFPSLRSPCRPPWQPPAPPPPLLQCPLPPDLPSPPLLPRASPSPHRLHGYRPNQPPQPPGEAAGLPSFPTDACHRLLPCFHSAPAAYTASPLLHPCHRRPEPCCRRCLLPPKAWSHSPLFSSLPLCHAPPQGPMAVAPPLSITVHQPISMAAGHGVLQSRLATTAASSSLAKPAPSPSPLPWPPPSPSPSPSKLPPISFPPSMSPLLLPEHRRPQATCRSSSTANFHVGEGVREVTNSEKPRSPSPRVSVQLQRSVALVILIVQNS